MDIDSRLNDIDDCLYRVAARVLVVHDNKILLVKEHEDDWWALPGGGIDHGEAIEAAVLREIEEELGVTKDDVKSDYQIAYYTIGSVVNAIPRMNLFFKVSVPPSAIKMTAHIAEWKWLTREEFISHDLHSSYDQAALARVLFE